MTNILSQFIQTHSKRYTTSNVHSQIKINTEIRMTDVVAICNGFNREAVFLVIVLLAVFVLLLVYVEHRDRALHTVTLTATTEDVDQHRSSVSAFSPTAPPPPYNLSP